MTAYEQLFAWVEWSNYTSAPGNPKAYCKVCMAHNKNKSLFGTDGGEGATVQDKNELSAHEKSASHTHALAKALYGQGVVGSAEHSLNKMRSAAKAHVQGIIPILLSAALYLIMESIPGMKFASLLILFTSVGVKAIDHKYNHHRYFWSSMYALSEVLLAAQLVAVKSSPFFSILVDGSTDVSTEAHVLIYIRYLEPSTFEFTTGFLCAIQASSEDAAHHFALIQTVIISLGLDMNKMIGFCSDGASTYRGCNAGVVVLLKEAFLPYMVDIHCSAHRTALVLNDMSNEFPILFEVDSIIKAVHSLFCKSNKRMAEWKAFARTKGVTQFRFPLYVKTRWFSRLHCITVLCLNLSVLMQFLMRHPNKDWPAAALVLKRLRSFKTLALLHLMLDFLTPMQKLNLKFQSNDLLPHEVSVAILIACQELDGVFAGKRIRRAPFFSAWFSRIKNNRWTPSEGIVFYLTIGKFSLPALRDSMLEMVAACIKDIQDRFSNSALLANFSILVPISYRGLPLISLPRFGVADLTSILKHFCSKALRTRLFDLGDGRSIMKEFEAMKLAIWKVVSTLKVVTPQQLWQRVLADHASVALFPNMLTFVYIMLLIPVQTAEVERGFSLHRIIKNRLTNRLKIMTIDSLLRLKIGFKGRPLSEFDIAGAAEVYSTEPVNARPDMHLARLHSAANGVDLSVLSYGIDDDEPDFELGQGSDEESEVEEDPWGGEASSEPSDDAEDYDAFALESEDECAAEEDAAAAAIACL